MAPPFDTTGVALVPATPAHATRWAGWREEPVGLRHNPMVPSCIDDLAARLELSGSDLSDRTRAEYRWMVELDGELVGTVSLKAPVWHMGHAEISYMVGERHHGRGIGTRAVALLVDLVFEGTDLHRLFALVAAENHPSRRLLARLGFVEEGVLREHFRIGERLVDEVVYGLLRREWPAVAKNPDRQRPDYH